jgi:(p)ppGpp synthase/HD superfamily hydrolase
MKTLLEKAKKFFIDEHKKANELYDGKPYETHLNMVYNNAEKFSYLIEDNMKDNVYCAAYGHDSLEDLNLSYNDIKNKFNVIIADLIYALTNEKGKTRTQRANWKYYKGLRETKYATYLKLCDRISNIEYSKMKNSRMFYMYKKENQHFIKQLSKRNYFKFWRKPEIYNYKDMLDYINILLS